MEREQQTEKPSASTKDGSMEEKIRAAAERLFLEKGFALTSTTEIAKEAGCNQALVHYYFRTKDQLFDILFEEKAKLFFSSILEISDEDIPFMEKLRRKISAHYDLILENPRLPFLIFNELLTNANRLESIKSVIAPVITKVFAQFETELATEIEKGTIRQIRPYDLIQTIVSLNVFPFLMLPIAKQVLGFDEETARNILQRRKEENIRLILLELEP